ncbi:hypothetical protein C8255_06695 [filamentous cyanobacterium CCP3]|nr:hypothetical protein C8255_06695 [filamentous cyanobacterium CCP3]
MQILFEPVFYLQLWHDYYLKEPRKSGELPVQDDLSQVVTLVPTHECQASLRRLRWVVRSQLSGLVVLAHVESSPQYGSPGGDDSEGSPLSLRPVVPVEPDERLTFWMIVRDRTFANYTNLPLTAPRDRLYYFSNLSGNVAQQQLHLSRPLSRYTAGQSYPLGHLVTYPTQDATLESMQHQPAAARRPKLTATANGTAPAQWQVLPSAQYVSANDLLPRQGRSRLETLSGLTPGQLVQFSLTDLNGQTTFRRQVEVPPDQPVDTEFSVTLNFTDQQPGYYRLWLNEELRDEFVLIDPMSGQNAFALIEISLHPDAVAPPFQLLSSAGVLSPKTYRLRFKNRATYWRYHCDRPHGFTATSLPPNLKLIDEKTYASQHPIGLRRQPQSLFRDGNDRPLPAPSPAMIQPTIDTDRTVTAIYSDIYL